MFISLVTRNANQTTMRNQFKLTCMAIIKTIETKKGCGCGEIQIFTQLHVEMQNCAGTVKKFGKSSKD